MMSIRCWHFYLLAVTATARAFFLPSVGSFLPRSSRSSLSFSNDIVKENSSSTIPASSDRTMDHSSLVLLEHINLNVPSHDFILPFYYHVLGCGMDPRKAANLKPESKKKTLWANCGASQFHLPYGEIAQRIPGEIGLWIREEDWNQFCLRVQTYASSAKPCIRSYERGINKLLKNESNNNASREFLKLTDQYSNVFVCWPLASETFENEPQHPVLPIMLRQPIISKTDTVQWGTIAETYGRKTTECMGIAYVEFQCPRNTAHQIAKFYKNVLEAPVIVDDEAQDAEGKSIVVAKVGFGQRSLNGSYSQYLIFRESNEDIGPYDGHHVALYVSDFDRIFRSVEAAGLVWVNPRFDDKATDMESARCFQQFRFKDIMSENGEKIFELEHEVRSLQHDAWPGEKQP